MADNPTVSFQEIEESLTCQCGCGLTVHSCNHLQCPSAIPLRQEIRENLNKGLTKEVILQGFADKYGEKILSAPTTSGFNLAAWVVPFLALGIAGTLLTFTLVRWRKRTAAAPAVSASGEATARAGSQYDALLQKELDELDR